MTATPPGDEDPDPAEARPRYRPWHVLADLAALVILAAGFLIRLPFRLLRWVASESWRHTTFQCWRCGAPYQGGAAVCASCGIRLPDAVASSDFVEPGRQYDRACAHCHTPYTIADYDPRIAEHSCSRCGGVLSITE
jgi:hypothetical protein